MGRRGGLKKGYRVAVGAEECDSTLKMATSHRQREGGREGQRLASPAVCARDMRACPDSSLPARESWWPATHMNRLPEECHLDHC
jgi:hypothetical protein